MYPFDLSSKPKSYFLILIRFACFLHMLRQKIFQHIDEDSTNNFSRNFNLFIIFLIMLNVLAIMLESVEELEKNYHVFFQGFESFSVVIFVSEYLLRLITADFKYPESKGSKPYFRYFFSTLALIDLLAILPSLLLLIAPMARVLDLRFIRVLRLMRLLRIFKISRYSRSMKLIGDILRDKKRDLTVTMFVTFILMIFSSTLMYYAEHDAQAEKFPNILATFWWAIATLTTVGYGDVFPITNLGKVISGIIALLGVGMVALPTGILSSAFVERINEERKEKEGKERELEGYAFKFCPHCGKNLPKKEVEVESSGLTE